jgi:phosphate-selective porin OprO/OprP
VCVGAVIGASAPGAAPVLRSAQTAAAVVATDPQQPPSPVAPEKEKKKKKSKDRDAKKLKKKKAAEDGVVAPDEPVDPDGAEGGGRGFSFAWKQHPSFRIGDAVRIDIEGKMQEDVHGAYGPVKGLDTWEFHRNRFGIKGYVSKSVEYEVEYEFTEHELTEKDIESGITPKSQWKDVYLNFRYMKPAQIQVGKFKVPFGLDELTGVTHNDFVYRSLGANYLAPGRDIGAAVHGSIWKHGFEYATGVFEHDGDNAKSKKIQGGDTTFAARVNATPFRKLTASPVGAIDIGSAFTISALSDDSFRPNGLRGRTVVTQDTFYESVYVKGRRRRWEADADWTVGRASARAEYTWVSDDRQAQGIGDQDLPDARARAWYLSSTYVLTGEDKRRPLKAAEPFAQGGIGAVELAIRYERMWFDSSPVGQDSTPLRNPRAETILPSGDKVLTLGINWTLNRFVKIQFNGIREQVEDIQRNPVPNGAAFWSRVLRFQFVL